MGSLWEDAGSQLDFNLAESQLANTQVDFSFLDFTQPAQEDEWATQGVPPSQASACGLLGPRRVRPSSAASSLECIAPGRSRTRSLGPAAAAAACPRSLAAYPLSLPQVPTFQPTQGDAALGLDAALSQLAFQDATEGEAGGEEQPAEVPEWACA